MTSFGFFLVVVTALAFLYWLNAMRAKEQARRAGKQRCDAEGVTFLDDSVVLKQVNLRRHPFGGLAIVRQYQFEFSSDGSIRYRGEIVLSNQRVDSVALEPYRIPDSH